MSDFAGACYCFSLAIANAISFHKTENNARYINFAALVIQAIIFGLFMERIVTRFQ